MAKFKISVCCVKAKNDFFSRGGEQIFSKGSVYRLHQGYELSVYGTNASVCFEDGHESIFFALFEPTEDVVGKPSFIC